MNADVERWEKRLDQLDKSIELLLHEIEARKLTLDALLAEEEELLEKILKVREGEDDGR